MQRLDAPVWIKRNDYAAGLALDHEEPFSGRIRCGKRNSDALRRIGDVRLSTRTGPFKAQFPTPIRPTRMIVWLAEGALLSAIVDEVDMGFSCLLKSLSVVGF